MIRQLTLFICCALFLAWGVVAAPVARGERPASSELLPEDTLLYVRIRDVGEMKERFSQTSMGRMAADPEVRPLLNHFYGAAMEAFLNAEEELGLSLDDLLNVPQGEMSFALVAPDRGLPSVFFRMDLGENADDARLLVDGVVRQLGKGGFSVTSKKHKDVELTVCNRNDERRFVFFEYDKSICMTMNEEFAGQMLDMWNAGDEVKRLRDNRKFRAIMNACSARYDETPHATFFVDPVRLAKVALRNNLTAGLVLQSLEPLGIDGMEGVGGTALFATETYDSLFQFHFLLGEPRKGLLNLLALKSGDTRPEKFVPRDAASYLTIHWDVQQTYREFRALYETMQGPDSLAPWIQRFEDFSRLSFEEDILNAPSGRITIFTQFAKPIKLNSQSNVIAVHLRDGEKTRSALEKIVDQFNTRFDLQTHAGRSYYKMPMNERARERLADNPLIRIPEPCITVLGDTLLYCDSEEVLKEVLAAYMNPARQLADRPDFQIVAETIEREARGAKIGMVQYQRPDETFQNMYEFINSPETREQLRQAAGNNGFFRTVQEALDANGLPPFETLAKYFAPGGAMMVDDETGYHYMAFGLKSDDK